MRLSKNTLALMLVMLQSPDCFFMHKKTGETVL